MTSLGNWPSNVGVKNARFIFQANQRVNASPFGGSEQVVDMLNDRWIAHLTLPVERFAEAAAVEAFLASFRGQVNTVNLYHFARSVPRGTLRGGLVTAASAAQGAASVQLQARLGLLNRLVKTEQLNDPAWVAFGAGAVPPVVTANAGTDPLGGNTADKLSFGTVNTGWISFLHQLAVLPSGTAHRALVYLKGESGGENISLLSTDGTNFLASQVTLTTSWQEVVLDIPTSLGGAASLSIGYDGRAPGLQTTVGCNVYAWGADLRAATDVIPGAPYQRVNTALDFDVVDYSNAAKTLLAGDIIGVGGQLLMVAADATTDATASATVQLVNRLRAAVASGAAVTWNAPTAPFRLLSHTGVLFERGLTEEVQCTFAEAIA
jgi:hypothetical protein